jgi:ParB/RepB/Spo0J family partition protein
MVTATDATLQKIRPRDIGANKDNPRLIFREAEMNALLDSIEQVGIQVPLSVYRNGKRFVLIDGERRWRCALRLNLSAVPAMVQPKPGRLENILTMFNIHNVRQDWDLMPTALKLRDVQVLVMREQGSTPSATSLAGLTGLSVPTVRRCLDLLDLPQKYQDVLLAEAQKPKDEQVIKVDLFVEINKAKSAIRRYTPAVFEKIDENDFVDAMVEKYTNDRVPSVTTFRDISKMARAKRAGEDPKEVEPVLIKLIRTPRMTIEDAYEETVSAAYTTRDLATRASSLADRLAEIRTRGEVTSELAGDLRRLRNEINRLLA